MQNALAGIQLFLIAAAIVWFGAGIFSVIWFVVRAACRKLGLARNYQILIPSAVCSIPLFFWVAASVDRLDPLERECREVLLKTTRMEGTRDLRVQKHYDFWTRTNSGGGWVMPWISRPYETPKVSLLVNFERDQRLRSAWINCIFSEIPDSGQPPQLAMQDVRIEREIVLDQAAQSESDGYQGIRHTD
ncbi:MAG TPA: hypothetical protein VFR21_02665 [Bradyrhizobium sp.]|jgi:hypothetical protein|nr:hypothetical protein [Bradyrhizobium sp.]